MAQELCVGAIDTFSYFEYRNVRWCFTARCPERYNCRCVDATLFPRNRCAFSSKSLADSVV